MTQPQTTTRLRWGIEHWSPLTRPNVLGALWIDPNWQAPAFVDKWPASYRTRVEARAAAQLLTERSRRHSPDWQFRAVRLTIQITVQPRG